MNEAIFVIAANNENEVDEEEPILNYAVIVLTPAFKEAIRKFRDAWEAAKAHVGQTVTLETNILAVYYLEELLPEWDHLSLKTMSGWTRVPEDSPVEKLSQAFGKKKASVTAKLRRRCAVLSYSCVQIEAGPQIRFKAMSVVEEVNTNCLTGEILHCLENTEGT